ncbi:MAG: SpoIIE family protein phosphatase [Phycisphaerae bacterium]
MLTHLVPLDTLHKLQDRFAALGQVTVCICTVDGELITEPTWGSRYSRLIGTSPRGRAAFAESIHACSKHLSAKVPVKCHEGMSLYAASIIHDDMQLAVIVAGTRSPTPPPPDTVRAIASAYGIDPETLLREAQFVDPYSGGTPEAIRQFADALAETIATLYGQAERIQRQLADLRTVHSFTELLSGTLDLQEILDLTVRRVVEVMLVKACAIRLLNPETGELVIKAVHNLSNEYLQKGPVLLHENVIDATAFAGHAVHIPDVPGDPRTRYPQNARREGIVSGLCVPLTYRGQTVGVIRVYAAKRYLFSKSEELLLRSIGSQTASAIITSRLWGEQAQAERFQRQVEAAGEIQQRMLPSQPPEHPALEFGCVYDPTLQVGGDFYDFIELPGSELAVCVADVVGKGLPAALMMASVRSALRAHAHQTDDVKAVVANVNQHLCRDTLTSEFATLVYGVFSSDARTFTYCNAGHTPPLLWRDDRFLELTTGGLVIGIQPEEDFDQDVLAVQPGDILIMVTDGVTEAMDFEGTAYGWDRLLASIRKYRSLDAQQLAQQILWDVRRFAGLADQSDDITIVVAKVR